MLCWLGLWVNQADAFFSILNHFCGSPVLFLLHFRGNPVLFHHLCGNPVLFHHFRGNPYQSHHFRCNPVLFHHFRGNPYPIMFVATPNYTTIFVTLFHFLLPLFCFVCHVPSWQTNFLLNELVMLLTHCSQWHLNKAYQCLVEAVSWCDSSMRSRGS